MADTDIAILIEPSGRVHTVELIDESVKIKGIGVLNPYQRLIDIEIGQEIHDELNRITKEYYDEISSHNSDILIPNEFVWKFTTHRMVFWWH